MWNARRNIVQSLISASPYTFPNCLYATAEKKMKNSNLIFSRLYIRNFTLPRAASRSRLKKERERGRGKEEAKKWKRRIREVGKSMKSYICIKSEWKPIWKVGYTI